MQTQAEAAITDGASVLLVDAARLRQRRRDRGQRRVQGRQGHRLRPPRARAAPTDRVLRQLRQRQGRQAHRPGRGRLHRRRGRSTSPNILVMNGDPTDNNAKLFAAGLQRRARSRSSTTARYVKVGEPAGTWTPSVAATTFEQQYTAHPNINAVVTPNDDNANAVIAVLQTQKIPPKTFPTTGQDASLVGPAEHPEGLPVRHRLQADLPRGAGRGGARALPAGRPDAAGGAGQRHDRGHRGRHRRAVGAADARSGSPPRTWPTRSSRTSAVKVAELCIAAVAERLHRRRHQ